MIFLILWFVGLVLAAIHVALRRSTFRRQQVIETFLLYQFVFGFGAVGIFGFMGHALNPVATAT